MAASFKVGIVGLGLIGSAWAKNLAADGVLAAAWNRTPMPELPKFCAELGEVPKRADVVHLVVSDENALLDVIEGILPQLTNAHTVIQSTTIDPDTSTAAKKQVEASGAKYLEAPFTGSLPAAQERKTVFYLGGDAALIEALTPYLSRLSQNRFHIGTNRQACTLKLVMNLQIGSAMAALSEALTVARRAGISDETFFETFRVNAAYSGLAALKEPKLRNDDFSPQFSVKHLAKDMRLLRKSAKGELRMLEALRSLLAFAEESGFRDEDFSSVIKAVGE